MSLALAIVTLVICWLTSFAKIPLNAIGSVSIFTMPLTMQ